MRVIFYYFLLLMMISLTHRRKVVFKWVCVCVHACLYVCPHIHTLLPGHTHDTLAADGSSEGIYRIGTTT